MLLAIVVVQLFLVAPGRAGESCAQPGALRCEDDGRRQSVCLSRSLVWHPGRDCAATGGVCADGRCVSGIEGRATALRAENCNHQLETTRCAPDCSGVQVCLATGVWYSLEPCAAGTERCDASDPSNPKCLPALQAKCGPNFVCTIEGHIPHFHNASVYYKCARPGVLSQEITCENGMFFDACTGGCDADFDITIRYPEECHPELPGHSDFLFSNPHMYYVCVGGEPIWYKCSKGHFENTKGECTGGGLYCVECATEHVDSTTATPQVPNPTDCSGAADRLADPFDLCWYYHCTSTGELDHRRCPSQYVFDIHYKACVPSEGYCIIESLNSKNK